MNLFRVFSLPLLTKELIEQAQYRRTYILRTLAAIVLYGFALYQYATISGGGSNAGLVNLGSGGQLFLTLVGIQFWLIFLLLPPLTCGAITVEKEKDTLALLLLTKLSPWTIVFEKMLSRVFAVGTYQLLSLPLFAIIYGMGGVEIESLIFAITILISMSMVVSSISIFCSTWFRTTAAAFVTTYAILACLFCFVPTAGFFSPVWNSPPATGISPIAAFMTALIGGGMLIFVAAFVSGIILLTASKVLVPRAFIPVRNLVLEQFQKADRFFTELNKQTTGGIELIPDRQTLPLFDGISWRETRKKSLGTFRYQFRILTFLLTPLIISIAMTIQENRSDFTSPFQGFIVFFWIISVLSLVIHSTGCIPTERIRQTLDVMLVMPLTAKEIVLEKLAGVRRLIAILTVPFVVLITFQGIWQSYVARGFVPHQTVILEMYTTTMTVVIYMPVIMWIGFHLGLRMRTQIQALLSTFAVIGAACVLPGIITTMIIRPIFDGVLGQTTLWSSAYGFVIEFVQFLNPLEMITRSSSIFRDTANKSEAWTIVCLHFLFYGLVWFALRESAVNRFSRVVGRAEPNPDLSGDAPVELKT